jgi:SAM-dependent methyltransferase
MAGFYATIARYYDVEHQDMTEDLPFYAELVEDYGAPVLVMGSGTGRVLLHLAQQGFAAHGIEAEAAMMERARRKLDSLSHLRDNVTLHEGDVFATQLDDRFKTTIIPYNTFMHFHQQEQQIALLSRLREWTQPGGVLALDLPNAGEAFAGMDNGAVTLERSFLEGESGHMVMQQSVSELDRVTQLMHVTWIYDEITADGTLKRTVAPVVNRYFFFAEIKLLLNACGFKDVQVYGDFDYTDFVDGCPRMLVLAK